MEEEAVAKRGKRRERERGRRRRERESERCREGRAMETESDGCEGMVSLRTTLGDREGERERVGRGGNRERRGRGKQVD